MNDAEFGQMHQISPFSQLSAKGKKLSNSGESDIEDMRAFYRMWGF